MNAKIMIQFAVGIAIAGILIAFIGPTMFDGMADMEEKSTSIEYDNYVLNMTSPGESNVTISDDPSLNPENLSISFWMKGNFTGEQKLIYKENQYEVLTTQKGNKLRINLYTGMSSAIFPSTIINDNSYHHIVLSYAPSNLKIYIDNSLKNSTSPTGSVDSRQNDLFFGTNETIEKPANENNYMLDSIQLYGAPLSTENVSSLYNNRYDRMKNKDIRAFWPASEGSGDTLYDRSGYAANMDGSMHDVSWVEYKSEYEISESTADLMGFIPVLVAIFIIIIFAGIILRVM